MRDVDRYIRARAAHPHAADPWLWLGKKGPAHAKRHLPDDQDRVSAIGPPELHPHQLRHTFSHDWPRRLEAASDAHPLRYERGRRTRGMPTDTFPQATGSPAEHGQVSLQETRVLASVSIRMSMYEDGLRYLKLIMCQLCGSTPSARCRPTGRSRRSSSAGSSLASTLRTPASRPRASWSRRTRSRVPPLGAR